MATIRTPVVAGSQMIDLNLQNHLVLRKIIDGQHPGDHHGREEIAPHPVLILPALAQVDLGQNIDLEEGRNILGDTGGSEFPMSCPPY